MVKIYTTTNRDYVQEAKEIAASYPQHPDEEKVMELLRDVQAKYRFLPRPTLKTLAEVLDIPIAKLYGPGSFYEEFSLLPRGRVHIKICTGGSCYMKDNLKVYDAIRTWYDLTGEEDTTEDQALTVETVPCMGRCGEAPVVQFNGEYLSGKTSKELLEMIAKELKEGAKID